MKGIRGTGIAWNKEGTRNVSNFVLPTVKSFFIGRNLERRLVHSRDFDEIIISSSIFTNMMNILFDLRRLWILLTQIPREIDDTVSRFADERRRTNFLGFFFLTLSIVRRKKNFFKDSGTVCSFTEFDYRDSLVKFWSCLLIKLTKQ